VRAPEYTPVLADAADVLSDQLLAQLERLGAVLKPHLAELDTSFRLRLRSRREPHLEFCRPSSQRRISSN
jgi:hypothetical protein